MEKSFHNTLIFLCFRQFLNKKVEASSPELSTILKILPLGPNRFVSRVDPGLGITLPTLKFDL